MIENSFLRANRLTGICGQKHGRAYELGDTSGRSRQSE